MTAAEWLRQADEAEKLSWPDTPLGIAARSLRAAALRVQQLEGALQRIASFESRYGPSDEALIARAALASVPSDHPFPVNERLRLLTEATRHLLTEHDCDHHGYETWQAAASVPPEEQE